MNNAKNTTNNAQAKITTEEAFEIIAENYDVIQQFENDYNEFIEKVYNIVEDDDVMNYLLVDNNHDGEIWKNLSIDHLEALDGSITAYVGMAPFYIDSYIYEQDNVLEGEEDGELPVEIRNFVAEWEDGALEKVLNDTMQNLNKKLDDYINNKVD